MTVKLTQHAAELLEAMRVQRDEPAEVIVEHALEMLASGLDVNPAELGVRASVLELQGLGKGIWQGIDAQEYVDRERASWNG